MRLSRLIIDSPLFTRLVRLGLATAEGDINESEWFERTRVREPEAPRDVEKSDHSARELQYLEEGTTSTSTGSLVHSTSTKKKTAGARVQAQNLQDGVRTRVRQKTFTDPLAAKGAKQFVQWFEAQYFASRRVKFFPEYGRDMKLAKTLIERYGYEHLQAMATAMLEATEDFWMMKGNRDLRQLMSRANFIDKWVKDRQ